MREGVLVMAYGAPRSLDVEEIKAYYTHIRRGRPPAEEDLEELVTRYRRIGGSPFMHHTTRQVQRLREMLEARVPGVRVYSAMKHVRPFIPDVARKIVEDGVERVVAVVLAPHESRMIIDAYLDYARDIFAEAGVDVVPIRTWHLNEGYLSALERRIRNMLGRFEGEPFVLFTAHSLPERILEWKDPYPERLRETAEVLAGRAGLRKWRVAYQSAGKTPFPWLGPDILEVLEELAAAGEREVLVVPIGFVSDHLEVLWDIDIEAREKAEELGIHLERTPSLNDDPAFLQGLAEEIQRRLLAGSGVSDRM